MSLTPPPKVRKLQDALHSRAKDAPGYRFYALYDKLYREDILRFAYDRCKANGGAPGVDGQSFADIEKEITAYATRARSGQISIEDITGGTFTITNGGVFGSLLSTPIVNAPQSAILGMHKIQERPMVVNGKIEIRPMMYLAVTYDHRIIDGRDAVQFLVAIKDSLEDPGRMLLGL